MKILHLGTSGAILDGFIHFVNEKFRMDDHSFMLVGPREHEMPAYANVIDLRKYPRSLRFGPRVWIEARRAEKIVLHGLFDPRLLLVLFLQPWLLGKCYWVIWGGDLYGYRFGERGLRSRISELMKRRIIPRIGHLVTCIRGDFELARQWYGAKGKWHECFMYPSNFHKGCSATQQKSHEGIHILLGNSATATNHHVDALKKLQPFVSKEIRIYCPLSYGNMAYGNQVAAVGKEMFGDKFIPLREFMSFESYMELLAGIDIAVFNHDRQQGLGNILSMLGMGKKVYLRSGVTTFSALSAMGLVVLDIEGFGLDPMPPATANNNRALVAGNFTPGVLCGQLAEIGF